MQTEISRLESSIAELLERTNNPLRAAQPITDQLEAKLAEALRKKDQIENWFRRQKEAWEEEKQKLIANAAKPQRVEAPGKGPKSPQKAPPSPKDDTRITELRNSLNEANKSRKSIEQFFQKMKSEWELESARLREQVSKLQAELAAAPSKLQSPWEKRLDDAQSRRKA